VEADTARAAPANPPPITTTETTSSPPQASTASSAAASPTGESGALGPISSPNG
jgi:hypothetical protein